MTNKELVETWFQRVWTEEDASAIHQMFAPSGQAKGLGARPITGPKEFETFQRALLGLINNVQIRIDRSFNDGDWFCAFCTLSARGVKSREEVEITGCVLVRIENEQIIEGYNHFEFMSLFEQVGLLPADTFGTCLNTQTQEMAKP